MHLNFAYQEWPYREVFKISRSAKSNSALFIAIVSDGGLVGRGECGILDQYGHTREDIAAGFDRARDILMAGASPDDVINAQDNSSVRNALDCAFWDLACKRTGQSIWQMTGVERADSVPCDLTISVNPIEKMCEDARAASRQGYTLLKLKADKSQVIERVSAIARAAEGATFVVDANEAWDIETLERVAPALARLGVVLIEQPLHHLQDAPLGKYRGPIPICADESCRTIDELDILVERYQAINIKLDKVGGLTGGLALARGAKARGLGVMLGCNGPTSLGSAPAYIIATLSDYVDLDGPALLLNDRASGMQYRDGRIFCFGSDLWG
jgi:L-alanine-DL-glutamate epimerase-like enolase superfamily enzyme